MNAEECNKRAAICAENAAAASDGLVSIEFLRTAAQWRAMAVREIFLGFVDDAPPDTLKILAGSSVKPI
jgi:hypothetical protein